MNKLIITPKMVADLKPMPAADYQLKVESVELREARTNASLTVVTATCVVSTGDHAGRKVIVRETTTSVGLGNLTSLVLATRGAKALTGKGVNIESIKGDEFIAFVATNREGWLELRWPTLRSVDGAYRATPGAIRGTRNSAASATGLSPQQKAAASRSAKAAAKAAAKANGSIAPN